MTPCQFSLRVRPFPARSTRRRRPGLSRRRSVRDLTTHRYTPPRATTDATTRRAPLYTRPVRPGAGAGAGRPAAYSTQAAEPHRLVAEDTAGVGGRRVPNPPLTNNRDARFTGSHTEATPRRSPPPRSATITTMSCQTLPASAPNRRSAAQISAAHPAGRADARAPSMATSGRHAYTRTPAPTRNVRPADLRTDRSRPPAVCDFAAAARTRPRRRPRVPRPAERSKSCAEDRHRRSCVRRRPPRPSTRR